MTITANSKKKPDPLAVIDVGTNSLKLLIALPDPVDQNHRDILSVSSTIPQVYVQPDPVPSFKELYFQRETTRLGNGLRVNGRVQLIDIQRTIDALKLFQEALHAHGCKQLFAFGTHALRHAYNARTTREKIRKETGIRIKVLSEKEEARYAFLSASTSYILNRLESILVDIGGGSTECVFASNNRITRITSLPLGALQLTRRFLKHDPVRPDELKRMEHYIWKVSTPPFHSRLPGRPADSLAGNSPTVLIASGGSASTLKRMAMSFGRSRGNRRKQKLSMEVVDGLLEHCVSLPLQKRKTLPGLEPDRADIIIAGLSIIRILMRQAKGARELLVNEGGVREGVIVDLIRKQSASVHKQ